MERRNPMKRTKRTPIQILIVVSMSLLFLALPRAGGATVVKVKFFGGYNFMGGGDLNTGLKGQFDMNKAVAAGYGVITQGDYNAVHGGTELGGDLIIQFSPIVGIGFGVSYLRAQSSSELTFTAPGISTVMTIKPQVRATPIRAGLYFSIPMGSVVSLSLNGGAEYYLANIKISQRTTYSSDWSQSEVDVDSKGKFGLFAGIGLEIKIHRNLSLFLEGRGRYARIDVFKGSEEETGSFGPPESRTGELWYSKVNFGFLGQFPSVFLSETSPSTEPMYQDVRSARLEFSGFSAIGGLMLRF
jgi:opacity protein-like surface antigen